MFGFRPFITNTVIPVLDTIKNRVGKAENYITVRDEKALEHEFVLVSDLAGGASARIYKSYSRGADALKPIAIKRIVAAAFQGYEDEFQQLIYREKFALTELGTVEKEPSNRRHYVTEFFGYYYQADLDEHWLTMEYADGGSVYNLTKNKGGPPTLRQIAAIAAGMLKALSYIHDKGFIHGDIKSGNILLTSPGIVKICDFGLASKVKGVREPDLHALGTLDYMAPEQMYKSLALDNEEPNAHRYMYDYKIDVWALGIIILELLLGRTPLQDLRKVDEDEFSFYIASMAKPNSIQNRGSALGYLFYFSRYHDDLILSSGKATINDRDLLCDRIPELGNNKKHLLEMLMRPYLHDKRPNPKSTVPKPKVPQLYMLNKLLDFVAQCLFIRYKQRPSAEKLEQHPFVKTACSELTKLEPNIMKLKAMANCWETRKTVFNKFPCANTIREINGILEHEREKQRDKLFKETL